MLPTGSEAVQILGMPSMPSLVILHKTGVAKSGFAVQVPDWAGGPWSMGRAVRLLIAVSSGVPRPTDGAGGGPGIA